jgi:hypothetical protein
MGLKNMLFRRKTPLVRLDELVRCFKPMRAQTSNLCWEYCVRVNFPQQNLTHIMSLKTTNPKTVDRCERWPQQKCGYSIRPLAGLDATMDLATCETRSLSFACRLAWFMAGFQEIWSVSFVMARGMQRLEERGCTRLTPSIYLHPHPMTPIDIPIPNPHPPPHPSPDSSVGTCPCCP